MEQATGTARIVPGSDVYVPARIAEMGEVISAEVVAVARQVATLWRCGKLTFFPGVTDPDELREMRLTMERLVSSFPEPHRCVGEEGEAWPTA